MVENRATSMRHVGMNREAARENVIQKLAIGQQYQLKSVNAAEKDSSAKAVCELMSFGKNTAIFKHRNGTLETFTYQELWTQIVDKDLI